MFHNAAFAGQMRLSRCSLKCDSFKNMQQASSTHVDPWSGRMHIKLSMPSVFHQGSISSTDVNFFGRMK